LAEENNGVAARALVQRKKRRREKMPTGESLGSDM
jgi:hypothetical protein